jgi:HEAT repeat protein
VLGEPGAGKTTILRHLAVKMADGALPNLPDLPVYVELRSFVESGMEDLLDFVVSNFAKPYNFPDRSYLEKKLNDGEAALLLDGLDEVLGGKSPEEAKKVYSRLAKLVTGLATQFSNAPIAVACRRAGWQGGLTGFHTLEVLDFDGTQIQEFVNNWFNSDPSKAKGLHQELEKNLRMKTLAGNPLILSLMAIVYEREMELPERRSELYQHCVEVLLEEWDSEPNRGIQRLNQFTPTQMQNLLIEVAWYFHQQGKGYFREAELLGQLPNFLSNSDINIPLQENKAILEEITGSSSLLKEAAYELYGFLHLTFQEYFAALAAKKKGSIGWQEVVAHRHEPWWEEVILLLAECMDDATPLLLGILGHPLGQSGDINQLVPEGEELAANDDLFDSDLLLAARCLAGKPTIQMHGLRDRIIAEVKNLLLTSPYNFDWERAARVLIEIGDQALTEQLLGMLTDNSKPPEQRASIASAFGEFGDSSVAQRLLTLLERATQLDQSVRMGIVDTLATLKVNDAAFCLLDMLKAEEDVTNQARIAEALVLIDNKSESVVRKLMEMLDTEMRMDGKSVSSGVKDIVWAVGRLGMGNHDLARSLLEMLLDETRGLGRKTSFAQALKNLRDASLTQEILERIQDKTIKWQLRWLLTETLEGLEESAKNSLMEMLKSQDIDERVRVGIAATLGAYGEQVVIPQLRKAIECKVVPPDWEFSSGHTTWKETGYVWHRIARVLKSLDDDSVVPTLVEALNHSTALQMLSEQIHAIVYAASEYKSETVGRQILARVREQAWVSPLNQLRLLAALPTHTTESLIPELLELLAERRMYFVPGWGLEDKILNVIAQVADNVETVIALLEVNSLLSSEEANYLEPAIYRALYSVSRRTRVRVSRDRQIEELGKSGAIVRN